MYEPDSLADLINSLEDLQNGEIGKPHLLETVRDIGDQFPELSQKLQEFGNISKKLSRRRR